MLVGESTLNGFNVYEKNYVVSMLVPESTLNGFSVCTRGLKHYRTIVSRVNTNGPLRLHAMGGCRSVSHATRGYHCGYLMPLPTCRRPTTRDPEPPR